MPRFFYLKIAVAVCVLLPAAQTTLAQTSPANASARADSAAAMARRDSLVALREYHRSLYRRFPAQADSMFAGNGVRQDQLFASDANGITEALRFSPKLVAAPFSLASSRNRLLLYGYPFDIGGSRHGWGLWGSRLNAESGADLLSTTDVAGVAINMPGGLRYEAHPRTLVSPEMSLFWENGVFRENILGVRLARPLARSLDLGFFSDYRYLAAQTYSHDNGNVHNFYASFGGDTSLLSNRGRNPLTNEHIVGARVRWESDRAGAEMLYKYIDTDNDAVQQDDSLRRVQGHGPLKWERVYRYCNDLGVAVRGAAGDAVGLRAAFSLNRDGHTVVPFSRAQPRHGGRENGWGFSLAPHVLIFGDTMSVTYEIWNAARTLYTGHTYDSREQRISLGYRHIRPVGPVQAALSGNAGHVFLDQQGIRGNVWTGQAALDASMGSHGARIFASSSAYPYAAPYDLFEQVAARLLDVYRVVGIETSFLWAKAGVMVSYCLAHGVDTSTVLSAWPQGAVPYACPRSVVTVAPVLGRWHGFGLWGRCMVSDAMPYVKAQAILSYQAALARGNARVRVDGSLDYWSTRDEIRFGDPSQWKFWKREIYDASLRASVQIASFRLYYKVDNLLNRRIAYVPGYFMPGLTFRWGFGWIIPE